ncbi:c-type cytochrome [Hyphomicrobium sp. CS1GBMeth3]|uniref:c-type cytochrome n=1 Tax=Hyphomicrobium sp. CS1GBMeth3 TaxID=1892845 RepID=UPI0009317CE5|nr:c-type cytochrome [Hyphomicrobium sp. CS1GBMeth3]
MSARPVVLFVQQYWRSLLLSLAAFVTATVIGAIFVAWIGIYNVGATSPHSPIVTWFLHFTMRHSVAFHSSEKVLPALDDPSRILRGAKKYELTCSPCHGAPDHPPLAVTRGMTPPPPPLLSVGNIFAPNELFWLVKHGIKMTAMPSWPALQRDDEIWDMVAFLQKLPQLNTERYRELVGAHPPFAPKVSQGSVTACAFCHGADGNGLGGVFPKIAGLNAKYIEVSLRAFRDGTRPSGYMLPVAEVMTDEDIKTAAVFFSGQSRTSSPSSNYSRELLQRGAQIARSELAIHAPACLTCHVKQDVLRAPGVPNVVGQSAWYLADQLRLFRTGVRSESHNARVMARYARRLPERDIEAVSAYLSTLEPESTTGAEQ